MKKENKFNNWFTELLNSLGPEEKKDVQNIWDQAQGADDSLSISVSDAERKEVFSNIATKTNVTIDRHSQPANLNNKFVAKWRWAAAAAVIIIAAGLAYLFIPVTVSAPFGQMQTVVLPDHSRVKLNSGTSLSYSRLYGYRNRKVSLEGEAFFEVQKGTKPFIVDTRNATVKVLGTKFNIRSWESDPTPETTVVLTEGSLDFYPTGKPDHSVRLKPGETSSVLKRSSNPSEPAKIATGKVLAWLRNRFSFQRQPVGQIIREIERRFNLSVKVSEEQILADSLTIYYNNKVSAEQIIKDICLSKGLTYRKVNGGFVIEHS